MPSTVHWGGENNWWCPPICLVCRLLQHARACGCAGTLVVPLWRSAPFWPILFPDGVNFAAFIQEVVQLYDNGNLIVPGRAGSTIDVSLTQMISLRLQFS